MNPKKQLSKIREKMPAPSGIDTRQVSSMITWMVSPYTLVLLILLDFVYLLIEALTIELLPLQLILYGFAGITGALLVFASEYLTNRKNTLGEKAIVAIIGGVITALPFPVLGVGTGLIGLALQYLAKKQN